MRIVAHHLQRRRTAVNMCVPSIYHYLQLLSLHSNKLLNSRSEAVPYLRIYAYYTLTSTSNMHLYVLLLYILLYGSGSA